MDSSPSQNQGGAGNGRGAGPETSQPPSPVPTSATTPGVGAPPIAALASRAPGVMPIRPPTLSVPGGFNSPGSGRGAQPQLTPRAQGVPAGGGSTSPLTPGAGLPVNFGRGIGRGVQPGRTRPKPMPVAKASANVMGMQNPQMGLQGLQMQQAQARGQMMGAQRPAMPQAYRPMGVGPAQPGTTPMTAGMQMLSASQGMTTGMPATSAAGVGQTLNGQMAQGGATNVGQAPGMAPATSAAQLQARAMTAASQMRPPGTTPMSSSGAVPGQAASIGMGMAAMQATQQRQGLMPGSGGVLGGTMQPGQSAAAMQAMRMQQQQQQMQHRQQQQMYAGAYAAQNQQARPAQQMAGMGAAAMARAPMGGMMRPGGIAGSALGQQSQALALSPSGMRPMLSQQQQLQQQQQHQQAQAQAAAAAAAAAANKQLLGKRSLQDLLGQVDPGGRERMDPDVEDLLLAMADSFIESMVAFSASLARHRKSSTLEAKDVMLHLEHNHHITIPGYGGDEYRQCKRAPVSESHKRRVELVKKSMEKSSAGSPAPTAAGNHGLPQQGTVARTTATPAGLPTTLGGAPRPTPGNVNMAQQRLPSNPALPPQTKL